MGVAQGAQGQGGGGTIMGQGGGGVTNVDQGEWLMCVCVWGGLIWARGVGGWVGHPFIYIVCEGQ